MEFVIIDLKHFEALKKLQAGYKAEIEENTPTEENWKSLYHAIENKNILFYGCMCEGSLIACCSVCPTYSTFNYDKAGVFEDFYILPEHRHKGIARKLVNYAYEESGIQSLTVGAADCDTDMYRSLGFSIPLGNMLAFEI
ncbi:MAG: GNAT family N-acetyltransferase [Clostridia bacterium]|jgi:GNAT superfamily N-acetyltransferase